MMKINFFIVNGAKKAAFGALICFAALCAWGVPSVHALVTAKAPDLAKQKATYVGLDTCVTCHEKQGREFKLSAHARISPAKAEDGVQGCEACHGPGSLHVDAGGGKGVAIINPRKDPSTCFACHMEKKMEFRLPYRHPVLEGKMSCADCHELHGPDAKASATSMEGVNDLCFKCHKDQQGPFVFEHPALREGCTTCHKVHGSMAEKMLQSRTFNLCLKCHTQANFPMINMTNHSTSTTSSNLIRGVACWGCHTKPHGSNFDKALEY